MAGYRLEQLGSPKLSWRDLFVLVRRWQNIPSTATAEALHGQRWDVAEQILAMVFDTLQSANWQRAGKKHAPKPKPLRRPWEKTKGQTIGRDPIPIADFDGWWDSMKKRRKKRKSRRS